MLGCPQWSGYAKKRTMEIFQIPPISPNSLTLKEERQLREHDAVEWYAEVVVSAVVTELEMVVARTADQALEVHLTDGVAGLPWQQLCTGQHLRVKLIGVLAPRVVSAEIA